MPEIGEVRDFATGCLTTGPHSHIPGVYVARMETEQRIWTGDRWSPYGSEEASRTLAKMAAENPAYAGMVELLRETRS